MKNLNFIIAILLPVVCFAQDIPDKLNENSILLKTGKYINKLQIRSFDSVKLEYIKGGNLCDLPISQIEEIVSDSGTIWFNEFGKPAIRNQYSTKIGLEKDRVAKDSVLIAIPNINIPDDGNYYFRSYEKGVETARHEDCAGWGIGTFLLGWMYGSPYLVSMAAGQPVTAPVPPKGVDVKLYTEGYKQQKIIERTKAAARGSSIAKASVTAFVLYLIMSIN